MNVSNLTWGFLHFSEIILKSIQKLFLLTGPILESKGMRAIFQKKDKKMLKNDKKGQIIWKVGQNCTKFENILKKAGDKVLERALVKINLKSFFNSTMQLDICNLKVFLLSSLFTVKRVYLGPCRLLLLSYLSGS